jgi:hypothetical protein
VTNQYEYDAAVNAVYIHLRDEPYAFGENLDNSRRIDYAADNQPIGIELLNVHRGVRLDHLPERDVVAKVLEECQIKVFA